MTLEETLQKEKMRTDFFSLQAGGPGSGRHPEGGSKNTHGVSKAVNRANELHQKFPKEGFDKTAKALGKIGQMKDSSKAFDATIKLARKHGDKDTDHRNSRGFGTPEKDKYHTKAANAHYSMYQHLGTLADKVG